MRLRGGELGLAWIVRCDPNLYGSAPFVNKTIQTNFKHLVVL